MNQRAEKSHYSIEPLDDKHNRAAFSCGVEPLDRYLQKQADQDVRKHVAAVFVITPDGETIAGFYSLSAHVVSLSDLPVHVAKKLPPLSERSRYSVEKIGSQSGISRPRYWRTSIA